MQRGARARALALSCFVVLSCWPLAAETVRVETTGPGPAQPGADTPAWPVRTVLLEPTGRYPHNVLGDIPAFTSLEVWARSCGSCRHGSEVMRVKLESPLVFEDTAARLWDVTGDGRPEIVVVESHERLGARLAVWSYSDASRRLERRATTAHIGTRFRWLAPSGIGDLAGDGRRVIAYVDRPHLARELVFVTLDGNRLREIARIGGVTNHRIGDRTITGGVRQCNGRDEAIVASADWSRLLAARVEGSRVQLRDLGALRHSGDFTAALACRI